MGVRGKKSRAALETERAKSEFIGRPPPSKDLTDAEAEVWIAVTDAEEQGWFSPSILPILAQYCRHCVQAVFIGKLVDKATSDPDDFRIKDYERLCRMRERETKAIALLATKMRITQQSVTNHRGNRNKKSAIHKPWETRA